MPRLTSLVAIALLLVSCSDELDVSGVWLAQSTSMKEFSVFTPDYAGKGQVQLALGQYGRDVAGTVYFCADTSATEPGGGDGAGSSEPCIVPLYCQYVLNGWTDSGRLLIEIQGQGDRVLRGTFTPDDVDGKSVLVGRFEDPKDESFEKIELTLQSVGDYADTDKFAFDEGCPN